MQTVAGTEYGEEKAANQKTKSNPIAVASVVRSMISINDIYEV